VLCLYCPETGRAEPLAAARRGELRISSSDGAPGLAGLCDLLLPDLIRRTAEWHRLRVASARPARGDGPGFRQAASALNLRPPDTDDLGSPADVATGEGRWAHSGPVAFPADLGGTGPDPLAGLAGRGLDPLALRLVLLGRRYRDPLTVTWPALSAAGAELASWRGLVADWANLPSRPLSPAHRGRIAAAFDDDLDTPAALAVLRDLAADAAVPPGARFETFADADRLFGLDLVRDVGRSG
jgi:cysteinyl-tRNA synthetase